MISGIASVGSPSYVFGGNNTFTSQQIISFLFSGDGSATTFQFDLANINPTSQGLGNPSSVAVSITPQQTGGLPQNYKPATSYSLNTIVLAPNGTLQKVTTAGASAGTLWQVNTSYTSGQVVVDPLGNWLKCTASGTSSPATVFLSNRPIGSTLNEGTAPVWQCIVPQYPAFSSTVNGTVTDNTVIWTCTAVGHAVSAAYDSPTATVTLVGTVATLTFSEALKASGTVITDSYGNSFTTVQWVATVTVNFNSISTTEPLSQVNVANTPLPVTGTFWQAIQPVSASSLPLPTGAATSANQTAPVSKGIQGTTAEPVQNLKDSGRNPITIYLDRVAGITTEALVTMNIVKGLAGATTGTSYTVTSGKTLRLQSIAVTTLDNATINAGRIRVRAASGTLSATSPIIINIDVPGTPGTAVSGAGQSVSYDIPDGYELPAGASLGITNLQAATTTQVSLTLVGYEY